MRATLLALLLFTRVAWAEARDPLTAEFEAAIALEGKGEIEPAVDALESFARSHPDHALAADALAEAASLAEARLHQPARALEDWKRLAHAYPQSRGARRATQRTAELERVLGQSRGEDLGAFQKIMDEAGAPASAAARAQMTRFLAEHPEFPLADQGLYWLGHAAEERGEDDTALSRYGEAEAHSGAYASRAVRARAALLLRLGKLEAARRAFESLSRYPDAVSRSARDAGLEAVRVGRTRGRWALTAAGVVLAIFLVGAALGRRSMWPPPRELRFFAPIALLFSAVAVTEHRAIARTVGIVAIVASLILWAAGAVAAGRKTRGGRLAVAAIAALGVLLASYLAIYATGLTDFVIETLRTGPDRE